MLDRPPSRRDLEASATVETLSLRGTPSACRTLAPRRFPRPKAARGSRYTSHDRALSGRRDLYVSDVPQRRLTLIWRNVCQARSVHWSSGMRWIDEVGLAWGGAERVLDVSQSHMRGLAPQVPGFVAGGRLSKNGRGLVRAAHSVTARPGGLRGPAPPHASGRAVSLGYAEVFTGWGPDRLCLRAIRPVSTGECSQRISTPASEMW